ncbi:hypothetical protein GDO78_003491 [Eleutherodactylus coqui]|uniref:Uncharacterized protein n=1 Tax=Eleutherodactylus coqui TaxID=57060 RepID=A0A8J6ESZ5_ELECQ|nr:hypothetical protein GDO78_003491 [Eleutherodactylus coqui]
MCVRIYSSEMLRLYSNPFYCMYDILMATVLLRWHPSMFHAGVSLLLWPSLAAPSVLLISMFFPRTSFSTVCCRPVFCNSFFASTECCEVLDPMHLPPHGTIFKVDLRRSEQLDFQSQHGLLPFLILLHYLFSSQPYVELDSSHQTSYLNQKVTVEKGLWAVRTEKHFF